MPHNATHQKVQESLASYLGKTEGRKEFSSSQVMRMSSGLLSIRGSWGPRDPSEWIKTCRE
jgi:hypothetical protein